MQATADLIKANEERGGKALVHCIFGVSRSVTLCISYLMMYMKSNKIQSTGENKNTTMGVYEALDYIRTKRCIARPNPGFLKQLVEFEKQIPELQADDTTMGKDISDTTDEEEKVINSVIQLTKSLQTMPKEKIPV